MTNSAERRDWREALNGTRESWRRAYEGKRPARAEPAALRALTGPIAA